MRKFNSRERVLVGILALILLGIGYYSLVLSPLLARHQETRDAIARLEIETIRLETAELAAVEAEITVMQGELHKESIAEGSLSHVLVFMEEHARENNLILSHVSVGGVGPQGGILSLSVHGTYPEVRTFLKAVESGSSSVIIDVLTLTPQDDEVHVVLSTSLSNGRILPVDNVHYPRMSPFSP